MSRAQFHRTRISSARRSGGPGPGRFGLAVRCGVTVALASLVLACNQDGNQKSGTKPPPVILTHDFGAVQHGHMLDHTFEVPMPRWREEVIAHEWQGKCDCVTGLLLIRDVHGYQRPLTRGLDRSVYRVLPGEKLLLRLTLDTNLRDPADADRTRSEGVINFLPLTGVPVPLPPVHIHFHFAIQAPVRIAPTPRLDLGTVPYSRKIERSFELRSGLPGHRLEIQKVECTDKYLTARLEPTNDGIRMIVTVAPDQKILARSLRGMVAAYRGVVRLTTNVPGQQPTDPTYDLLFQVTGNFTNDVVVLAPGRFGLGMFDFKQSKSVFLVIQDHRPDAGKLTIQGVFNDKDGADISKHFQIEREDLPNGRERIVLQYLGTAQGNLLRGEFRLARNIGGDPVCRIPVTGYNSRS